jgi:hypothetical protein
VDTLHTLAINSVRSLLSKLTPISKPLDVSFRPGSKQQENGKKDQAYYQKTGMTEKKEGNSLIKIEVELFEDDLRFSPDIETFNEAMEAIIGGFVDSVVAVPKLITHVRLHVFVQ